MLMTLCKQTYVPSSSSSSDDVTAAEAKQGGDASVEAKKVLLWDRKSEGGFPGMFSFSFALAYRLPTPSTFKNGNGKTA
jgi:predicted Rdx family selenoprotein